MHGIKIKTNKCVIYLLFVERLSQHPRPYNVVQLNERLPQPKHEFSAFEDVAWSVSRGPEFSVRPMHVIEYRRYQLTNGKICVTLASFSKSNRRYGNEHEGKTPDMLQILCLLT
jgi:hypothetical protein